LAVDRLDASNPAKVLAADRLDANNPSKVLAVDRLDANNPSKVLAVGRLDASNPSKVLAPGQREKKPARRLFPHLIGRPPSYSGIFSRSERPISLPPSYSGLFSKSKITAHTRNQSKTPINTGLGNSNVELTASLVFLPVPHLPVQRLPVHTEIGSGHSGRPALNSRMSGPRMIAPLRPRDQHAPLFRKVDSLTDVDAAGNGAPGSAMSSGFMPMVKKLVCKLGPAKVFCKMNFIIFYAYFFIFIRMCCAHV
jgi:hypothetical protein